MTITLTIQSTPDEIRRWRKTRAWRNLATQVVHEEPTCWLRLPGICQARATTADHIVPVAHRPDLANARSNCRGACKPCNDYRRDTPAHELDALRNALRNAPPSHINAPSKARRHIAARRRPSRAAGAFFGTTPRTPGPTPNALQRKGSRPRDVREMRCATTTSTAPAPSFFRGCTAPGTVAGDISPAKNGRKNG